MEIKKKINNILLIVPAQTISREYTKEIQPPLGLAYIAACLEHEYNVKIIDAACEGWDKEEKLDNGLITYGLTFRELKDKIRDFMPDVVGVSCLFSMQRENAHKVCAIAKEVDNNIIAIMGGAHPSALPEITLADRNVDFVVLGEGEYSTKELLKVLDQQSPESLTLRLSLLDGIAFRDHDTVRVNPKTRFIEDLDQLAFPARHLLPMEKYFKINLPHGVSSRNSPNTPVITSRGCPANCIFCSIHSLWGDKYRARSPENVLRELHRLKEKYNIREIQFEDDNLTFDKPRAMRLFNLMIQENLNIAWTTPNGVALWNMDKELLLKMKQSGCYKLCLAIESGDQAMLNNTIGKPLNLKKVEELIPWVKRYGMESEAFFIVGFPEETKEQMKRTFDFASKLKVDNVSFYIATPYPGTLLYKYCQDLGLLPGDFSFSNLGVKRATISTRYFSKNEIERLVALYTIRHKVNLIWRNPVAFYRKVIKRLFKTPDNFISMTRKFLTNMLKRN